MKQYNKFQVGSTAVSFGRGASLAAADELKAAGKKKVLIVTDAFIAGSGMLGPMIERIAQEKISYVIFSEVESDPSSEVVEKALSSLRKNSCDSVIGFGGGSAMDTAKATRILATNGGSIFDYDNSPTGGKKVENHGLFLICVPTTAGTGSEVTPYAIITNKEENRKATISTEKNLPEVALLDPELTMELPSELTASTGMDAFAHALAGYTSGRVLGAPGNTTFTDVIALKSIQLIAENLRTAVNCKSVYQARENMMMASMLGAMASSAGGDACHGLGHALGAVYHVPHGIACAAVMPYVVEYNCIACPERFAKIAKALGVYTESMSVIEAAYVAAKEIRRLMNDIHLPDLKQYIPSVEDEKFELLCRTAVEEKCSVLNSRPITMEVAKELLIKAYNRV